MKVVVPSGLCLWLVVLFSLVWGEAVVAINRPGINPFPGNVVQGLGGEVVKFLGLVGCVYVCVCFFWDGLILGGGFLVSALSLRVLSFGF